MNEVEFTILMPCLNEEKTIGYCIREAKSAIRHYGISAEILIADNGSSDASKEIAKKNGARVIEVPKKGYGNAVIGGIRAAKATSCYKAASKKVTIYAVPAKAKLKEVKSAKGKVEAEWKKDSNASGYQVLYSTDKKMKKAKTMNCNKKDTTATIKNLKKNKTCYVKVRAYKTIDGKKYYGAYSDKMSVKVK